MNPFTTPDRIYISRRPQDMRAGIQRLACVVTTDFGMDPTDGALYCFVSRDCEKMKLLRFETIFPKYFERRQNRRPRRSHPRGR